MAIATFTIESDGAAANADSLPTAVCRVAGADTADVVTVTNLATGEYRANVTETATDGQWVEIVASVTVGGVTQKRVIYSETYASTPTAALAAYDAPTKAELDSAVSPLATSADVEGITLDTTGLALQASLLAVKAKTDTIGAVAVTAVSSISDGDEFDIVAGADHTGSRAFSFTYTGHDLTTAGTTARIRFVTAYNYRAGVDASALQATATISATNASSGTITAPLTAAQSAVLQPSQATHNYRWQVQIVPAVGDAWVIAQGWANVGMFHDAVPSA